MILAAFVRLLLALFRTPAAARAARANVTGEFDALIAKYVDLHRPLRASLLKAVIWQESNFNPQAIGDGGAARGLCQMHREACTDVGANFDKLFDPESAIAAGAAYLGNMIKEFQTDVKALMAWNQGPSTARESNPKDARYNHGMNYAGAVLSKEKQLG